MKLRTRKASIPTHDQLYTTTRVLAAFVFGYESAAIASGEKVPTITSMCLAHKWLGPAVVAGLIVHLAVPYWKARVSVRVEVTPINKA